MTVWEAWEILEIEPTRDKKKIKKAYAAKLKNYHPEEYPEKFKMLREAYQAAMDDADAREKTLKLYADAMEKTRELYLGKKYGENIEPADDKKKIEKAHAAKLKYYHPEQRALDEFYRMGLKQDFPDFAQILGEAAEARTEDVDLLMQRIRSADSFKQVKAILLSDEALHLLNTPYFYEELYRWIQEKNLPELELRKLKEVGKQWRNYLGTTDAAFEEAYSQISKKLWGKIRKRKIRERWYFWIIILALGIYVVYVFSTSVSTDIKRNAQENSDFIREYLEENYGMQAAVEKSGINKLNSEEVIVYDVQMETGEVSLEFQVCQQRFTSGEKDKDGRRIYTNYLAKAVEYCTEKAGLNTSEAGYNSGYDSNVYAFEQPDNILYESETDDSVFAEKVSNFSREMGKMPGLRGGTVFIYDEDILIPGNNEKVAEVIYESGEGIDEEKLIADIEAYDQKQEIYNGIQLDNYIENP